MGGFNLVGFCEATPGTGTNLVNVGLLEAHYTVTNNTDLQITKEAPYVLGVFGVGVSTLGDVILRQPKMIDYHFKKCSLVGDVAPLCSFSDYMGRPLPLRIDKLNALVVNATDEAALIGVFLGSGKITQAMKDQVNPTHVISGYGDTTITTLQWSRCPITWGDLDAGTYEIVGMRASVFGGADMALMRLLIPGASEWRPGVIAGQAQADHEEWQSLERLPFAQWPLMGIKCTEKTLPNVECLGIGASTDQNLELQLQKVG